MALAVSSHLHGPIAVLGSALVLTSGLLAASAGGSPAAERTDVGPGPGSVVVTRQGYRATVRITPNSSRRSNDVELAVSRGGAPLRRASVSLRFEMPSMSMGAPRFGLREARPGVYRYSGPVMNMDGSWVLTFQVRFGHGRSFSVVVRDHVRR